MQLCAPVSLKEWPVRSSEWFYPTFHSFVRCFMFTGSFLLLQAEQEWNGKANNKQWGCRRYVMLKRWTWKHIWLSFKVLSNCGKIQEIATSKTSWYWGSDQKGDAVACQLIQRFFQQHLCLGSLLEDRGNAWSMEQTATGDRNPDTSHATKWNQESKTLSAIRCTQHYWQIVKWTLQSLCSRSGCAWIQWPCSP